MKNISPFIIGLFHKFLLLSFILLVLSGGILLFIKIGKRQTEAEKNQVPYEFNVLEPIYSYEIINQSPSPKLNIGESATLSLKIKNTGNTVWQRDGENPLFLGTSHPLDRQTVFFKERAEGWFSGNRIAMQDSLVYPAQSVDFIFEITAPQKSGIYREFFTPLVEYKSWLEDKGIYWDIEVRDPGKPDEKLAVTINSMPLKYIRLNLGEQRLYAYENGELKYNFVTSTGKQGMSTPTGEFKIYNKFSTQYSPPYDLYMDNWMAITQNGLYGIHALPYWKLKSGGKLYEGESHLGKKVSHGCIRLSVVESKILYDWAKVGIPVFIEN